MTIQNMTEQLAALSAMRMAELSAKYAEVFGEETRSRNAQYLRKKIAYRIQEIAEGGLSERARKRLDELADRTPLRRYPLVARGVNDESVGGVLRRTYNGVEHVVHVRANGYEHQGTIYTSLTAVAKAITGQHMSGRAFFGLAKAKRRAA